MSERRWHGVQGASSFKSGMGRFERGEALVMIAALGVGTMLFRILNNSDGLPVWLALVVAAVIPVGVCTYLAVLVVGKPRHYAIEFLTWRWMRLARWLSERDIADYEKPLIEIESNERR